MERSEFEKMMERSKFENQFFHLRKIILDGISYFIVWQELTKEYEDSKQNLNQNKGWWWQYRGFFAPARNALLWSALMQLSKAFDKDTRTVSLNNLLVTARNNPTELTPYAMQDSLEDIQVMIFKNIELLHKLKRYRNRRLAHHDSKETENIELPLEEVKTLIEETKSIYNSLKFSCDGKYDNFDDIMEDVSLHTSQVVTIMRTSDKHG